MALTVKRASRVSSLGSKEASPIQHSSMVKLKIYNPGFVDRCDKQCGALPGWATSGFMVLNTEPLSLNVSTSWKDGAGASIAGKLNDLMDSTILKVLAGESLFQPIATDSWSQQILEKGSPIACKVKFRVYFSYDNSTNANVIAASNKTAPTYIDLIQLFTRVCTPPRQYSLWNGITGVIGSALQNAKQTGKDIKTASEYKDEKSDKTEVDIGKAVKYTIAAATQSVGLDEPGESALGAVRGQFTFTIETEKMGCAALDWILKSFTWTPSQQMVVHYKTGYPFPLWIDFDCDFETNICPSTAYVSKFMLKSNKTIK